VTENRRKLVMVLAGLLCLLTLWVLSGLTGWPVPDALWASVPTVVGLGVAGNVAEHWTQRPATAAPTAAPVVPVVEPEHED